MKYWLANLPGSLFRKSLTCSKKLNRKKSKTENYIVKGHSDSNERLNGNKLKILYFWRDFIFGNLRKQNWSGWSNVSLNFDARVCNFPFRCNPIIRLIIFAIWFCVCEIDDHSQPFPFRNVLQHMWNRVSETIFFALITHFIFIYIPYFFSSGSRSQTIWNNKEKDEQKIKTRKLIQIERKLYYLLILRSAQFPINFNHLIFRQR